MCTNVPGNFVRCTSSTSRPWAGGRGLLWSYQESWENLNPAHLVQCVQVRSKTDPTCSLEEVYRKDPDLHMRKEIHLGSFS